jgi:hypothetical protein
MRPDREVVVRWDALPTFGGAVPLHAVRMLTMTRALVLAFLAGALVLAKVHRDARRWRTEWDIDDSEIVEDQLVPMAAWVPEGSYPYN